MLSTTILFAVLLGALVLSLILWVVLLRGGLRWAKAQEVTWRRIIAATAIVTVLQLAITFLFLLASPASGEGVIALSLLELVVTLGATCLVIAVLFKISFPRAMQAWLPTLLAPIVMALFAWFVFRPFLFEAFVSPTNSMAPTLIGRHWRGVCPNCGQAGARGLPETHGASGRLCRRVSRNRFAV